jgi:alcohol dehydrogenase class IV
VRPVEDFTWHDGERVVRFGRGAASEAVALCGGPGFALLTTPRTRAALPALEEAAGEVHMVPAGLVDELAGDLLGAVRAERVVALGGGRVVDVAKALVAARGGRAMAVPTTLSGAEMTVVHRTARGAPADTGNVRPAVVVNDPALSASQPEQPLAASALNALAHAVEGPCTLRSHPVARLTGREAERLLAAAFPARGPIDRDALALGSLLAGSVIDSTGYGIHHVMAQTLARVGGAGHGQANAVLLPHTMRRLGRHDTTDAERILARSGARRIRDLGVPRERLEACADAAAGRPQLDLTPPRAGRDELLAIYDAAW